MKSEHRDSTSELCTIAPVSFTDPCCPWFQICNTTCVDLQAFLAHGIDVFKISEGGGYGS